jgi:hypothetical protein
VRLILLTSILSSISCFHSSIHFSLPQSHFLKYIFIIFIVYFRRKRIKQEKAQQHKQRRGEKKAQKKDIEREGAEIITKEHLKEAYYQVSKGKLREEEEEGEGEGEGRGREGREEEVCGDFKFLNLYSFHLFFIFPPLFSIEYRRVVPYDYYFKVYAKGRWLGREILEVFTKEFSRLSSSDYVLSPLLSSPLLSSPLLSSPLLSSPLLSSPLLSSPLLSSLLFSPSPLSLPSSLTLTTASPSFSLLSLTSALLAVL